MLTTCQGLLSKDSCLVRDLAEFVGTIVSLFPVVGNCSGVATKRSQICVANADSWDISVQIPLEVKREILIWKENVVTLNHQLITDNRPPRECN